MDGTGRFAQTDRGPNQHAVTEYRSLEGCHSDDSKEVTNQMFVINDVLKPERPPHPLRPFSLCRIQTQLLFFHSHLLQQVVYSPAKAPPQLLSTIFSRILLSGRGNPMDQFRHLTKVPDLLHDQYRMIGVNQGRGGSWIHLRDVWTRIC